MFDFATTFLAAVMSVSAPGACTDLAITHVAAGPGSTDAVGLTTFPLTVSVRNVGPLPQTGDTLDSIGMFVDGGRVDVHGLRPLRVGETQRLVFAYKRSVDAGSGSTHAQFRFVAKQGLTACHPSAVRSAVDF